MLFYPPGQNIERVARLKVSIYWCRTNPTAEPPVDDACCVARYPHARDDLISRMPVIRLVPVLLDNAAQTARRHWPMQA